MPKILRNTTSLPSQDAVITSLFCVVSWSQQRGEKTVGERASWSGCKGRKGLNGYVSVPDRNASTELAIELVNVFRTVELYLGIFSGFLCGSLFVEINVVKH